MMIEPVKNSIAFWRCIVPFWLAAILLTGCDIGDLLDLSQLWTEPRDLLMERVKTARDAQQETVEQFKTTMEEFKSVTRFNGGDLEREYNRLQAAFDRSEAAVKNVELRIDRVESAAKALMKEWKSELKQYHDPALRDRSERQLEETQIRAERLIDAMRRAEVKTKPVLDVFRDQVLFLKHNLNMQAITSLDAQTISIETDVSRLIAEMEASINEANRFIAEMDQASSG